jgi:6,7-dimethyl-8-ribityllumazine synthase
VDVAWVPGAFELPAAARRLAESRGYDAVVCLGAVIRGETPHFEFVAGEAARGIADVGRDTGVPTIFGVITPDSLQQALERAGGKKGNKGFDAVVSAIEMANLFRQLRPD